DLSLEELQARMAARALTPGDVVKGRVVALADDVVTVDVGGVRGPAPRAEFGADVGPGAEVEVYVDDADANGVQFSRDKARRLAVWSWIEAVHASGESVPARVLSESRGAWSVELGGVKAILPYREVDPGTDRTPAALLGRTIDVRVIRIREKKGQVIVSQRAPRDENVEARKAQTLGALAVGQIIEGEVKRIADFGVFVDVGGIDGLVRMADLSWHRVRHAADVVEIGDTVSVKVLTFDPDKGRVGLGIKQALPDPWTEAAERYTPGTAVTGEVVGLTDFGAFIALPDGIEGLVHQTEMSFGGRPEAPKSKLRKGQRVQVWVLRVDAEQKRLGLTMRDPAHNPWRQLADQYPVGTRLRGKVARVADFGIFIGLAEGLDGLVHRNDFSWGPVDRAPRALFKPGDEVEVMVLGIDVDRGRATLGIKQLHEDLTSELIRNYAVGQVIEGTVTSLQPYGAFIELEPGLEGLAPIGELSEARVSHPEDVVQPGQRVRATVLSLEPAEKRVGLSLKGLPQFERAETTEAAPAPDEASPSDAPAGDAPPGDAPPSEET
ncbi:MAG: S1 RNA-binding domain-containing protein, partial [Myxococcales bacterium]|nr:S1 RNA-binding domain-containing protein [Myxococcales bacterium]